MPCEPDVRVEQELEFVPRLQDEQQSADREVQVAPSVEALVVEAFEGVVLTPGWSRFIP